MNESLFEYLIRTLPSQIPLLLVYLVGFVMALMLFSHQKVPSLLAMFGFGTLLLTTILSTAATWFVIRLRFENDWTSEKTSTAFQVIAWGFGLVRAGGMGLVVGAVFAGRGRVNDIRTDRPRRHRDEA